MRRLKIGTRELFTPPGVVVGQKDPPSDVGDLDPSADAGDPSPVTPPADSRA